MADDDILILSGLGNDNPFNSLNNFLSSMTGSTTDYTTVPIEPKQYYVPFDCDIHYDDSKVYLHDYNNNGTLHDCYEAYAGVDDAVINVDVTVPHDGDIYMHLGSEMRRAANVWVAVKGEDGVYRGKKSGTEAYDGYGTYFNTNSSPVVRMGPFNEGDEVEIRLTIPPSGPNGQYDGSDEYIMIRKEAGFNFYYLDEKAFAEDIAKLKANPWNLDMSKTNDRYLVGDIDAQDGQILMTTIPYEPGWEVKIDGKTVDSLISEEPVEGSKQKILRNKAGSEGEVIVLGTLIGIRVPAGHHTVSMKYTPPGFNTGVITLILGAACLIFFYMYDKKHNKVLKERQKAKKILKGEKVEDEPEEEPEETKSSKNDKEKKESKENKKPKKPKDTEKSEDTGRKKVEIIKSKGAVAPIPVEEPEEEPEEEVNDAERFIANADEEFKKAADTAEKTAEDSAERAEKAAEELMSDDEDEE